MLYMVSGRVRERRKGIFGSTITWRLKRPEPNPEFIWREDGVDLHVKISPLPLLVPKKLDLHEPGAEGDDSTDHGADLW